MKKYIFGFIIILLCNIFSVSYAEDLSSCFDYYKFQSVQVSVGTESDEYNAGDTISFSGQLVNENTYPVVDGNVFVRISRTNDDYITDGHYAVDEFIAKENISIDASSSQPLSFTWVAPQNLEKGEYRADYFFSVGKQFNLGGLPFTNEITIGFDVFNIESDFSSGVYFDRTGTKLNGDKYYQIGSWPVLKEGSKATISQIIKNSSLKDESVEISYDLYYWDSLDPADVIDSKQEVLNMSKGQSKTLTYEIPKIEKSVYYLKITAKTEDGAKSILNVRLSSNMEYPRINYFGITDFPLKKGESAKIFSCFHNTSNINTEGKVVLSAKDKKGEELANFEYSGSIASSVSAKVSEFISKNNLTYIELEQTLYDKSGQLIYQKSEIYDCSTLDSFKCKSMQPNYELYFIIAFVLLLVLALLFFKKDKRLSITALILALCIGLVWVALNYNEFVLAEVISSDGKTKSNGPSVNYKWVKGTWNGTDSFSGTQKLASEGQVTVNHSISLVGDSTVVVGDTIKFVGRSTCSFSRTGGAWDTPYCGTTGSNPAAWYFTDPSGRQGYLRIKPQNSVFSATSNNNNIMSCSVATSDYGETMTISTSTCTAKAPGTIKVTAGNSATNIYAGKESYVAIKPDGGLDINAYWVCYNGTHTDHNCFSSNYWSGDTNTEMILYDEDGSTSVNVDSYYPKWNITVVDVPLLQATCSGSVSGRNIVWTSQVTSGNGPYTYSWSGTEGLSGTTNSVSKTYNTIGTKDALVEISSGGQSVTAYCSANIPSSSATTFSASCLSSTTTINVGNSVIRDVNVEGGDGVYTYLWTGSQGLSGTESSIEKSYLNTGTATGSVMVSSEGVNIIAECPDVEVIPLSALSASCHSNVTEMILGGTVIRSVNPSGGVLPYSYDWTGTDSLEGTDSSADKSYNTLGVKEAEVVVTSGSGASREQIVVECPDVEIVPIQSDCEISMLQQDPPLKPDSIYVNKLVNFDYTPELSGSGWVYKWIDVKSNTERNTKDFGAIYLTVGSKTVSLQISNPSNPNLTGYKCEKKFDVIIGNTSLIEE